MTLISTRRAVYAIVGLLTTFAVASPSWETFSVQKRIADDCPDYNSFSKERHGPYSDGPLKLPYMRPSKDCRTFSSPAVEVSTYPSRWRRKRKHGMDKNS
jgi:hypothetical protein